MSEASPPAPAAPAPPAPLSPLIPWWRRLPRPLWGLIALIAVFIFWEILTSFVAYTDDAYVRTDLIAVAPEVSGHLVSIAVSDNEPVAKGQLLARIDPVPFQLAVEAAAATLQKASADAAAAKDSVGAAQDEVQAAQALLIDAKATAQRQADLSSSGFASRQVQQDTLAALQSAEAHAAGKQALLEDAKAKYDAAKAAVAEDKAALAIAQWQLSRTQIFAPADGTITNFNLHAGDLATQNIPLIGIVSAHGWRIIANYKQSYLRELHAGATAWVWLDANPWHFYRARLRSIGRGIARTQADTGLLPFVSPTTDWIRLQHRFPVTVDLTDPPPDLTLYMGADARVLVFP